MSARAVRFDVLPPLGAGDPDEALPAALDALSFSWGPGPAGTTSVRVSEEDADAAALALDEAGFPVVSREVEEARDWVAESAALRRPVAVGTYLLDPHEGEGATPARGRRRLELPAARAFGTGSHESTRLAIRLLLGEGEGLRGARVLDVGCGTGTLAFVAALEGAASCVALDIDPDSAFATRLQAVANGLDAVRPFAGPLAAIGGEGRFDLVLANMLQEEVTPLLPGIRRVLVPGGRLLASGQLLAREREWLGVLAAEGFRPERLEAEGEWLGTAATLPGT